MADSKSFDDSKSWNKSPHGLVLGESFTSLTRTVDESLQKEYHEEDQSINSTENNTSYLERLKIYVNDVVFGASDDVDKASIKYLQNSYLVDSSVGGMDCINPHWQFGVDDDIRHRAMLVGDATGEGANKDGEHGLGRVYHEMYYLNQKNIYLTFGVPQFYNIKDFIATTAKTEESELMNSGDEKTLGALGQLVVAGGLSWKASRSVMQYAIQGTQLFRTLLGEDQINKFYGLKPTMPLYYKLVNTILGIMAVNMNLYPDEEVAEEAKAANNGKNLSAENYPPVLRDGPDIYAILNRRRHKIAGTEVRTTDGLIELFGKVAKDKGDTTKKVLDFMSRMITNADDIAHNMFRYIAFRLESGETPSETISSQTGESTVASTLNSAASAARDKAFLTSAAISEEGVLGGLVTKATNALKSLTTSIAGESASEVLVSGNGYVDMPEVWKNSSFSKTQSFTLQLRARSGDKISIFQSIQIPLAMLMAGAMPRGIGENAYTQPFLLEGYAAGLYSCPMGIIDSISIKRGKSEFGWTHEDLPTAVDVTVSIKDLTPVMFLSLMNPTYNNMLNSNIGLLDYLNTLSGMTLADRTFSWKRLKRLRKTMFLIAKTTTLNPMHYSHRLGDTWLAKLGANVSTQPFFTPNN